VRQASGPVGPVPGGAAPPRHPRSRALAQVDRLVGAVTGGRLTRRAGGTVRLVRVGTGWRVRSDFQGRRLRGSQVLGSFRWRD
jgi:hypothetical protein